MPYSLLALLSVITFSLVHLWADRTKHLKTNDRGRLLSMGEGVAIAYVFILLLPKLAKSDLLFHDTLHGIFPYVEKHVYILALIGFLLFFAVGKSQNFLRGKGALIISLSSYTLFNFLVGYAVVDKNNPEVKPLLLFTIAIALHFLSNDFTLTAQGTAYEKYGKWILILSLYLGWLAGDLFTLSSMAIALVSAFIGGGVIVNVMRHEFIGNKKSSLSIFLLSALTYAVILLFVGR